MTPGPYEILVVDIASGVSEPARVNLVSIVDGRATYQFGGRYHTAPVESFAQAVKQAAEARIQAVRNQVVASRRAG